jgi:hypothetical protein
MNEFDRSIIAFELASAEPIRAVNTPLGYFVAHAHDSGVFFS